MYWDFPEKKKIFLILIWCIFLHFLTDFIRYTMIFVHEISNVLVFVGGRSNGLGLIYLIGIKIFVFKAVHESNMVFLECLVQYFFLVLSELRSGVHLACSSLAIV